MLIDHITAPRVVAAQRGPLYRIGADLVTFKATGEETGDAYALFDVCTPPGAGMPPHRHRYEDATFFVLEGCYSFAIDGQQRPLAAGDYAYVPRGAAHAYTNDGHAPARMLVFMTPGGICARFLAEAGELLTDVDLPPLPPNPQRLAAVAAKYGIEIL